MQQIGHFAALEPVLAYILSLRLPAAVEVVAVGEGGVAIGEGATVFVGGSVVLAKVEAAGQRAGARIIIDKAGHRSQVCIRLVGDAAFDEAVSDLNRGTVAYYLNHARGSGCNHTTASRDVHVADAAREGGGTIGLKNQSGQILTVARRDLSLGAQIFDGGAVHILERGDVALVAGIPVERERVALSVEGAEVRVSFPHHPDVLAEVHVLHQLGVKAGLSAVHTLAERLPVGGRGDGEIVLLDGDLHGHGLVGRYGRGGREVAAVEDHRVRFPGVVGGAKEFLCRGQAAEDGAAAGGVAGGRVAVVVELHLVHPFRGVGGGQRLVVGAERLSPDLLGAVALQQLDHFAALQPLDGYLLALHFAARLEVVAVGEGGVGVAIIDEGAASSVVVGVVRAKVEAADLGARGHISKNNPGHRSIGFIRLVGEAALDHAVGEGNRGTGLYRSNHAHRVGWSPTTTSRDVLVADAVGNGGGAIDLQNHSGQLPTRRRNLPLGAQILDRGVLHTPEGGDLVIFARIPVELQRMALSVEGAAIHIDNVAHHHDVRFKVYIPRQLDVEIGLAAVHAVAEHFPVFFRADGDFVALCPRRRRQHEDQEKEAEPLNDVFGFVFILLKFQFRK